MSTVERSTRRPLFRWVAVGSAAAFLLSTAYTQAWAGLIDGGGDGTPGICNNADPFDPDCPIDPGDDDDDDDGDDDDDDDGLEAAEKAGIAAGAALGLGLLYVTIGPGRNRGRDNDDEQSSRARKTEKVTGLRFKEGRGQVSAGERRVLELEAQGADGKWRPVTAEEAASIEVKGDSAGLQPLNGTKNVFALPISTPATADGKRVTLVGHYGGRTATTTLQIQVGG